MCSSHSIAELKRSSFGFERFPQNSVYMEISIITVEAMVTKIAITTMTAVMTTMTVITSTCHLVTMMTIRIVVTIMTVTIMLSVMTVIHRSLANVVEQPSRGVGLLSASRSRSYPTSFFTFLHGKTVQINYKNYKNYKTCQHQQIYHTSHYRPRHCRATFKQLKICCLSFQPTQTF